MTLDELLAYFDPDGRRQTVTAESLGIRQSVIADWKTAGHIPFARQKWIEEKTRRKLRADPNAWRQDLPKALRS